MNKAENKNLYLYHSPKIIWFESVIYIFPDFSLCISHMYMYIYEFIFLKSKRRHTTLIILDLVFHLTPLFETLPCLCMQNFLNLINSGFIFHAITVP